MVSQDTVQGTDRANKYKEENRQILKESIEVAPFTAKIQRSSEPGMDRDRERCREPAFPARIPALATPNSKSGHAHPHVIHSEKSKYFTTLSNSVVNEPPRLYPSKAHTAFYDKVSIGASGVVASVGATLPIQGGLSLGSYSPKGSLSKPPPLIKHQPEGGEGLAGKITEQLSQQVTLVQPYHPLNTGIDRIEQRSPVVSTLSSSTTPNPQHIRTMPSLHRAPVFHPPTQHMLEHKEAADRDRAAYGGRLSPPTLTPITPVSLAATGNKCSVEQQKPPTLLPELRDLKAHRAVENITSTASTAKAELTPMEVWRSGEIIQEKGGARVKPHAAMASVIVRSSASIKYDSPFGAYKSGAVICNESPQGRFYPAKIQEESLRPREIGKDTAASRVIQSNSNLGDHYKKPPVYETGGFCSTSSVCRTAVSSVYGIPAKSVLAPQDLDISLSPRAERSGICNQVLSPLGSGENRDGMGLCSTSPEGSVALPSPAGTPQPNHYIFTPTPVSISGGSQPYSFVHLKKHKAALAAAQSRSNLSTTDLVDKGSTHHSPPLPSRSQASPSFDSSSNSSASGSTTTNKSSPLHNGQSSAPAASTRQSSNYHKLKKAWLTRHSEEDRNTTNPSGSTGAKAEKGLSTSISSTGTTNSTTAISEMIKPCTVNLSASTSNDMDVSKECSGKAQLEEKLGATGEERRVPSSRRGTKRPYESGSESGADDSDTSESKMEGRAKRQPKPTYKKKQNDMAKRKGDNDKEEDDMKPNGIFRSAREKTKLKLASSSKTLCSFLCRFVQNSNVFTYRHAFFLP